jgi:tetratricopeptide (TPR) repeat protein
LKKRLYAGTEENILPRSLYWFCYDRSELDGDTLPEWLKAHSQVYFVARPAPPTVGGDDAGSGQQSKPDVVRQSTERVKDFSGQGANPQQLPADVVLEKLISSCGSNTPELLSDPLGKLASHLYNSFLKDADKSADRYGIGSVIQRICTAKKLLDAEEQTNEIRLKAEKTLDCARRLQHRDAIQMFAGVNNFDVLSPEQLKDLLSALWAAAKGLYDNSDDELTAYGQVVALGNALKERGKLESEGQERVAKALYNQAVMLATREQTDAALAVYENLRAQFDKVDEPSYQELVAKSFINEGLIYSNRNEYEVAIKCTQEVIRRFADSTNEQVREPVAYAHNALGFDMIREAKQLWQGGDETAARAKLAQALAEINNSLRYAPTFAYAWGNLGYIQFLQGQQDEAQASLIKAVQFGGEEMKPLEIEDSHMNEIPALDEQFRALVNSISVPPVEAPPVTPPEANPGT